MTDRSANTVLTLEGFRRLAPDERLARIGACPEPDEALIGLIEDAERLTIDDLDGAMAVTPLLLDIADGLGGVAARVRARRARAQALCYASEFASALTVLDEAFTLAEATGSAVDVGRIRMTRLHALAKLGRYDDAVHEGERARRNFLDAGNANLAARVDVNLGVAHRMRGDPARALAHFDRATPLLQHEPLTLAQVNSNRAEALLDLGDYWESERAFNAALESFVELGAARAAAIVEGNLGDLMSRQGRLEGALRHFERARRALERQPSTGELARIEAEQADAFMAAGLVDEAVETFRDAIPRLLDHGLQGYAARAQAGYADALREAGRSKAAAEALEEAHVSYAALGHQVGLTRVAYLSAIQALRSGAGSEARRRFEEVAPGLGVADSIGATVGIALADLACGNAAEEHLERLSNALERAESLWLLPLAIDVLHTRAIVHRARGDGERSIDDLHRAVGLIERVRSSLRGDRHRRAFLGGRATIFHDLARAHLERGSDRDVMAAFEWTERGRSRSLLDQLHGRIGIVDDRCRRTEDPNERALLNEVLELQGQLTALYGRFDHADGPEPRAMPEPTSESVASWERRLAVLEARLAATGRIGELFAPEESLAGVQRSLADDSTLVSYAWIDGALSAFVVRHDDVRVATDLVSRDDLVELLERFQFQISRAVGRLAGGLEIDRGMLDDVREVLGALHARLLTPLELPYAATRRLFVAPVDVLHALPIAALWDGNRYLVEHLEVAHCPSASLLAAAEPAVPARSSGCRALVVGVGDGEAPRIDAEIDVVASALPGATVLRSEDATVDRLTRMVPGKQVVHIACHGRFVAGRPQASGLKLHDRWLTIRDAYQLDVRGATVVLSACESGLAAVDSGEELEGMMRALLAAGARSVVFSQWAVNDEATAELMASFHSQGRPPGAALRAAQVEMLAQRPHPVYWSPFVVAARS